MSLISASLKVEDSSEVILRISRSSLWTGTVTLTVRGRNASLNLQVAFQVMGELLKPFFWYILWFLIRNTKDNAFK